LADPHALYLLSYPLHPHTLIPMNMTLHKPSKWYHK
jgi:hypothetical protein